VRWPDAVGPGVEGSTVFPTSAVGPWSSGLLCLKRRIARGAKSRNGDSVVDDEQDRLLTRRRLLAAGAVVVAGVALPATSASAKSLATGAKAPKPLPRYPTTGYRRSRFSPHVGTAVELLPAGGPAVGGTLADVLDVPYIKGLAGDEDTYTLRFRGPAASPLAEGMVGVRHQRFGVIQLYITPAAAGELTRDYLAVINRRVPRNARRAPRRARS
jgi:hypothetical protein